MNQLDFEIDPMISDQQTEITSVITPNHLSPGLLLDAFSEPIVIHRSFIDITQSITAALLLSYFVGETDNIFRDAAFKRAEIRPTPVMTRTYEQIHAAIGLTITEFRTARTKLIALNVLIYTRAGMPALPYYLLDLEACGKLLQAAADARWAKLNQLPDN